MPYASDDPGSGFEKKSLAMAGITISRKPSRMKEVFQLQLTIHKDGRQVERRGFDKGQDHPGEIERRTVLDTETTGGEVSRAGNLE